LPETGFGFLRTLLDRLEPELRRNQTTLIFTNVRSLAERLTWALRRRLPAWAERIAVHHSSLSAVRRRRVERRLKNGELRVAVSSTSLELGIDIGSIDGVVLVHPPGGVVRLLQRIGRSGHAPDRQRRGRIFTSTAPELLEAAVTGACGQSGQFEPLLIPAPPLDVLCQQLLGMAAQRPYAADEAYALACRAHPYRHLSRRDFDDCLDYLSGHKADGESWLPPRLRWHSSPSPPAPLPQGARGEMFTIADERTARLLRRNIGTIIADEPLSVVLKENREQGAASDPVDGFPGLPARLDSSALGQVDEPFADRLQAGDRFLLDGRCLEFQRMEGRSLVVEETPGYPRAPYWQGNGWPLSPDLARRLYLLRTRAAEALREGRQTLDRLLRQDYRLETPAITALIDFFQRQECVSEIPDPATCLVETVASAFAVDHYIHTPLNRAGNDALARIAVLRLARYHGRHVTSVVADLGFLLSVGDDVLPASLLRDLFRLDDFERDLEDAIADSWSLRERFHRVALTGLMLLRNPLGRRRRVGGRDWAERRLFDQVRVIDPDFVLLRQAWREVKTQLLDAETARRFLEELPRMTLHFRNLTSVSPLAESWTQLAAGPSESVISPTEALEKLHAALMAENQLAAAPV
jgi:ATP-dependent Lhr-like helicase